MVDLNHNHFCMFELSYYKSPTTNPPQKKQSSSYPIYYVLGLKILFSWNSKNVCPGFQCSSTLDIAVYLQIALLAYSCLSSSIIWLVVKRKKTKNLQHHVHIGKKTATTTKKLLLQRQKKTFYVNLSSALFVRGPEKFLKFKNKKKS